MHLTFSDFLHKVIALWKLKMCKTYFDKTFTLGFVVPKKSIGEKG